MQNNHTGDANQITRDYFDSLLVEMRQIDCGIPDTGFKLFGEHFNTPIMMAALSHLNQCREDGMAEMARGALAAGAVNWAGMGDNQELSHIVETGAKTIKIVKPYADEGLLLSQLHHAQAVGCLAVGIDIDHSFDSQGQHDVVLGAPMVPLSQNTIARYVKETDLPFVIKGVLSVQDAIKCAEAGVCAIVVSHHHGIMKYAVPPLYMLPAIREAVGSGMKIFVDCGVDTGYDAFKALALGADAVSAGRVIMGPLHDQGAQGVEEKIVKMTQELAGMMARTCAKSLKEIDPSVIHRL